ncbi:uncharacterized protein Z519_05956 [Cladophialophora bantiana CBS 173.52]|uniref:Uncharacterized protein n=1 Tax=Cladophialophora bantiana (strain ATCC 10958 / CBS 173.52 / CDC B-1940 / NIH 8579) TaxID=1442370 RepID=A0A0D2ETZ1_CLAB1|nr:uncharacterized protein Z519_05956 [Cladophialophora bantiana CBS 173.52]KIW93351.1 hypothetical protein Z519_05956 [Cladophialophora bantiana CBS 173.52]
MVENQSRKEPRYQALHNGRQARTLLGYHPFFEEEHTGPDPQVSDWKRKAFRAAIDLVLAVVPLLFVVFGILAWRNDGRHADPGSVAVRLVLSAKYGPTVFPIMFTALIESAMKAFATWRIQRGTTLRNVEQMMGSHIISGAFITQAEVRAANTVAFLIALLWTMSPFGSQASLWVVSIGANLSTSASGLAVMDTFVGYTYSYAEAWAEAEMLVGPPPSPSSLDPFHGTGVAGMSSPLLLFMADPLKPIGYLSTDIYHSGRSAFELRMAQILNSLLIIGTQPQKVTGQSSTISGLSPSVIATTNFEQDVVYCHRLWLVVLLVASLTTFLVALAAAGLRIVTTVPDVLGSLIIVMLDNRIRSVVGRSTWSASEWAGMLGGVRVRLGDISNISSSQQVKQVAVTASMTDKDIRRG